MMIEVTLTNLILIATVMISGVWALLKMLAMQFKKDFHQGLDALERADRLQHAELNARLEAIQEANKVDAGQWGRVERELMNLKAELPLHYVRREDHVQTMAQIMTRLDSLSLRIENILLKGTHAREN